jgi:hypothetical protein
MPWTPTQYTLNCRAIADNLLAYMNTNQSDALTWANGASGMKAFQSIANSLADRTTPVFPAMQFLDDNDQQLFEDGVIEGAYVVTFETMVQHATAATAISQARIYAKAISSMIRNCPNSTLISNTGASVAQLQGLENRFDPIKTNDMQNDFLQVFQTRATYLVEGAGL